jgi:DNA-binding CsgD family transcriptional regulator
LDAVRLIVAEDTSAVGGVIERALQGEGLHAVGLVSTGAGELDPNGEPPVVRALLRREPSSLIVLDGESDEGTRAHGYVLGTSPAARLAAAMQIVAAGGDYLDPDIDVRASDDSVRRLASLSKRENEILGLLAEGLSGQAIAERLYLSPETVRTHVRNATNKLGAKTRVQAVALLVRDPVRGP